MLARGQEAGLESLAIHMGWLRFLHAARSQAGISIWPMLAASLLAGCGPQLPGVVSADGYVSGRYALDVRRGYDAPAAAGLMPDGWKLDNFHEDEPKRSEAYQTVFHVDADGDGDADWDKTEPAFELRFVHLRHAGVAWLRAVPVSHELAKKDLHVLVLGFVEGLAGGEYETLELSPGRATTIEKRFASTLLNAEPCRLAAQECEAASIELANVDQLKLDPTYRSHKLMVVLTRTSFAYAPVDGAATFPVYLVAGYSNQPSQFDAGLRDFIGLLQHVEITGHRGFSATPGSAVPAAPASAAPVAPPAATPAVAPVAPPIAAPVAPPAAAP